MLHDTIRRIREVHKLTQEEVAERLSLAVRTYTRLESGETRLDWERMRAIAEVYDMSPEDLVAFDGKSIIQTFNVESHEGTVNNSGQSFNTYYGAEKELYEQLIAQLREEIAHMREDMAFLREELVRARRGEG